MPIGHRRNSVRGIKPGMTALDIFGGDGSKAELMARPGAKVYAENAERG